MAARWRHGLALPSCTILVPPMWRQAGRARRWRPSFTGPGNALLDDFLRLHTGTPLDIDGRAAASGTVDEKTIERLLAHPFFALPPPKSLDRNDFRGFLGETFDGIGVADGAATLTALTAAAVVRIVASLPRASASF